MRTASPADVMEMARLAGLLFASMGMDADRSDWREEGARQLARRLGHDAVGFVVDHPRTPGRLVAGAAGTVAQRLPSPVNPLGTVGYVQWVCTDERFRGRGLGREVMAALVEWFDGQGVPSIELHATPMAEPLYLSLGFSDLGPRALRRRRRAT